MLGFQTTRICELVCSHKAKAMMSANSDPMKTGFIARSSLHLILVLLFLFSSAVAIAQQVERKPRNIDPTLQIEGRVDAMVAKLSLEQEIDLLNGTDNMWIRGAAELGMPTIKLSDGPTGVRVWGPSTAYPVGIALAASWNCGPSDHLLL